MDKAAALKIAAVFAGRVREIFSTARIILYGSTARGQADANSDIDIAVIVENIKGDFLDAEIKLYRLRRDIDDRIEPILIIAPTDRSGFLEMVERTGIQITEN
jgi:predicted nucleotidyltransferase